ncbi:Zinc finger MYND domain-containing protein 12, partial [Acanthisitta chloris]
QKHLIDQALSRAQGFVEEGRPEDAIPVALQALQLSAHVYGTSSVPLLHAYLLLAQASVGIGNLPQAAKYLSEAQWIVLQTPDCSAAMQSKLQRGLGLFCAAEGNFDQAMYHLASDVYLSASVFGLKSLEVSKGYFHMANIFSQQNKLDIANSLYAEVTASWHAWLLGALQARERALRALREASPFTEEEEEEGIEEEMTGAQRAEATRVLQAVLEVMEQAPAPLPGDTAQVLHALAMLHYLGHDLAKAREVGMKAFNLAKQLPQQDPLESIGHLLELIDAK